MKKKTITTATAFGLLVASVPAHAMPVDLNLEDKFNYEKFELEKETKVAKTSVDGVPAEFAIPENEWMKVNSIADLKGVWDYSVETNADGVEVVVLKKYLNASNNPKVEIPRELDGKKVELSGFNSGMFSGVTHIKVAKGNDDNKVKIQASNLSAYSGFYGNGKIEYLDLRGLDVSGVTNFTWAFGDSPKLQYVNLEGWNLTSGTNLTAMLGGNRKLHTVDFSGWNLVNVTTGHLLTEDTGIRNIVLKNTNKSTFQALFNQIKGNQDLVVDATNLDLQGETSLEGMFNGASGVVEIKGLGTWNTSNITNMKNMFYGCTNLVSLDGIGNWDVQNVESMESTFKNCSSLEELDLSNWETTDRLITTNTMFSGCSSLTTLDLTGFNMTNVTQVPWMFQNCTSLTEIKGIETWTLNKVERTMEMFKGCTSLKLIDLSSSAIPSNADISNMFTVSADTSEEGKKLLVITDDEKIKQYNFTGSNRTPATLTLDANGGEFDSGESTKTKERNYYLTTSEFEDTVANIESEVASLGTPTPTKDGYKFIKWELVGDYDNNLEMLCATYKAVWILNGVEDLEFEIEGGKDGNLRVGNTLELVPIAVMDDGSRVNISESEDVTLTIASGDTVSINRFTTSDQTSDHYVFQINGLEVGTTELTLTYGSFTKTITVNVFDYEVENGKYIVVDLNGNATIELKVNGLYPETKDLTEETKFEVVDKDIATVSGNTLTALKKGTTEIKVTTEGEEWTIITLNVVDTTLIPDAPNYDVEDDMGVKTFFDKVKEVVTSTSDSIEIKIQNFKDLLTNEGVTDVDDTSDEVYTEAIDEVKTDIESGGNKYTTLDSIKALIQSIKDAIIGGDDEGEDGESDKGESEDDTQTPQQPPVNGGGQGGGGVVQPPSDEETDKEESEDDTQTPQQPPVNGGGGVVQPPSNEETDKEENPSTQTNEIENLKDLDKELQEKVDSLVAESVVEKQGLILNIKGDNDDMSNINYVEVTKEGVFAVVNGEKLKFDTAIDGLDLDLNNARVVRIDLKSKALLGGYSPVAYKNIDGGLKISSNDLENILITSKVSEPFVDVNDTDWFKSDVEEAFNYGFTQGTSLDTYNPHASITRGEFAVMIARALELKANGSSGLFTDTKGKWYENEVQALKDAGIVLGLEDGTFGGDKTITRQESAKMLLNVLEFLGVDTTTENVANLVDMEDVSGFAQQAVQFLSELEVLIGDENKKFNPKNNLTRAEMAKILVKTLKLTDLY